MSGSSLIAASAALLLSSSLLFARAPRKPEPGTEHQRLNFFAGTWNFRLEMKPNPFGPGGIVTGTDHNEMLPGGFFLVWRYKTSSPVGEIRGLEVIGYDSKAKAYLQHGFDSLGQTHTYRGAVDGKMWTWTYGGPGRRPALQDSNYAEGSVVEPPDLPIGHLAGWEDLEDRARGDADEGRIGAGVD